MKIIDLKCPNCGGTTKANAELTRIVCPFCEYEMLIDHEIKKLEISGGYDFGYQAEMGRLKAQDDYKKSLAFKDEFTYEAGLLILENQKASVGMLQRAFKIGFNRGWAIMNNLEELGVVGPDQGTQPRKILITKEQYINRFGNIHP